MSNRKIIGHLTLLLLLCLVGGVALAQGTPTINRWVIGGGGGTATGGNVSLSNTLGQTVAGPSSGGNVAISAGFWSGGPVAPAPAEYTAYLPLVVRGWPPIPDTPVLNAISNSDGDGNYTVSWSTASQATSYVLQEARNSEFADADEIYSGASTSHAVSDSGAARYYYRVKARNSWGDSGWSNVEWVDVLWEREPNDASAQANGPIVSGLTYHGTFPGSTDPKDYFYFDLPAAHTVELWLKNIPAGHNYDLTLRNANEDEVKHSGELGNANEHILTGVLPAGRYYIQVFNASQTGSTQPYHLRVLYE